MDSILLIDTFFVLFQSSRGRYAGLIVPEDLFCKRVFQTSFLCQLVIKSLRNDVMSPIFFWRRFHMRRMLGIAKACKSRRQEIHPPRQSDVAISFPVMHSSSQYFCEMFETKGFEWFFAMPLFLYCALVSGVGRTFIDPCPKLKAWLRVSPLCKILDCHLRSW